MACAAAASSNPKRKLRIKERRSPVRRGKHYHDASLGKVTETMQARRLRTPRVGGLETALLGLVGLANPSACHLERRRSLIWRGEKNRGDHQTI